MADRKSSGRYYFPDHLCELVSQIAAIYEPRTAIDPCCEDVALIGHCDFVSDRQALFRNPSAMQDAAIRFADVSRELEDITRSRLDRLFDLVVTVVPFGARDTAKGRSRRLDLIVAERCLDIIAPNGIALIIIPANFLTAPLFSRFRDRVLDNGALDAVIELPPRSVFEQSHIGGALLVIRHGPPRSFGTLLAEYDLGNADTIVHGLREGEGEFFVSEQQLRQRWDRNYHDPAHQSVEDRLDQSETKRLEELGNIFVGNPCLFPQASESGEYLVVTPRNIREDSVCLSERDRYVDIDESDSLSRMIVEVGDVLVSLMPPRTYVYKSTDPPAVVGPNLAVIRAKDNEYISSYLNTAEGKELFTAQAERHATSLASMPRLSVRELLEIRIPILPLDDLNAVSDQAIRSASVDELATLRDELLRVKQKLEVTEAKLERERQRDVPALQRFVEERFAVVVEQQQATNAKLDQIVHVLASMRDDIGSIKQSSRGGEEKLARICIQLDHWTNATLDHKRTIEEYTAVVQTWLDHWDVLETLTQTFLPSAEHLYDELERVEATDFSPFIVQYCRAIENEILVKLFIAYHDDIKDRIADIGSFVAADLDVKSTARFARSVADDNRKYTLGDMNWTMQLIKPGGRTLSSSALLQDFRAFVLRYFGQRVAEKEFLDRVKEINDDLRNKAAHPYLMSKEFADKCMALVRLALSEFLDLYRENRRLLDSD